MTNSYTLDPVKLARALSLDSNRVRVLTNVERNIVRTLNQTADTEKLLAGMDALRYIRTLKEAL